MKNIIILFLCFISLPTLAQKRTGEVRYKRTIYWNKVWAELPYLTQAQRDRELLVWDSTEGYNTYMKLAFNSEESFYTHDESVPPENGYSPRKNDYNIYRNFKENKMLEHREMLGRAYRIEDDLAKPKWRIMNELKEILGHLCMKAVLQDTIKEQEVVAWFAADIPVSAGPELHYGLPGLILGLNIDNGNVIIEADKLSLYDENIEVKLPKRMKGREVDLITINGLVKEHFATSLALKRIPYQTALRY